MTPADSEHSAIFQCLQGVPPGAMRKVILTASGGAFRDFDAATLRRMAKEEPDVVRKKATTHPNWDMGAKITVDSATMMNKGLEVIEAHYLFGADYDDIDVVVHPQSIVHSAIETQDNSVIAQMGWPDMRLPILYSIAWPHRVRMPQAMWEYVERGRCCSCCCCYYARAPPLLLLLVLLRRFYCCCCCCCCYYDYDYDCDYYPYTK